MLGNNQKVNLEKYNHDYIIQLYNQIFDDKNLVLNVNGDGNCWIWSVIQAVSKKKIEYTNDDWKLMRSIRQKAYDLGFCYNDEGKCIKDDGVWFDGQGAFCGYDKIVGDENFSFTVIKPSSSGDIFNVTYSDKMCSGYKNMFIDLKNGGPAVIAQNRHYKSINWENRDEFCRKLLELLMFRSMYSIKNKDPDGIKNYFVSVIDHFFYTDEDEQEYDENELTKNLEKIFEGVEDKEDKYIELIEFFYSEFERVYINESKTPKANKFLSMLLKNFKEKYIIFIDSDDKNKFETANSMELSLKNKLEIFFSKDSNRKYNKEKQLEILNSTDDKLKYGLLNLDKVLGNGYSQRNSVLDEKIFSIIDNEVKKKLVEKQIIDYGKFDSLPAPVIKLFLDKNYVSYISDKDKQILYDMLKKEVEFFINLPLETKEILNDNLKLDLKYDKNFEVQKRNKYINEKYNKGKTYVDQMFSRTDSVSPGHCWVKASIQAFDKKEMIDFSIKENKDRLDKFENDVVKKYPEAKIYKPGYEDGYWGDPRYPMLYLSEENKITTATFHIFSTGRARKLSIYLFKSGEVQARYTKNDAFPDNKIKNLCIKDLCDFIISGCPVVLANYFESDGSSNHVQSLKNSEDERKEFLKSVIEILYNELVVEDFFLFDDYSCYDRDFISTFLENLFDLDEKDKEAIETKINDAFKYVDGIFRIYRELQLGEFLVKEFSRVFIDNEENKNKDLGFNDFFYGILERFEKECPVKEDWIEEKNIKSETQTQENVNSSTQDVPRKIDPNQQEQEFNNKINDLSGAENLDELEKYYKSLAVTDKQKFIETAKNKAIEQYEKIEEKLKTKNKNLGLDFGPIKIYLKNCANLFCDKKNRNELLNQIENLDVMRFYNYISELIRRIFNFKSERSKFGFKRLKESMSLRKLDAINTKVLAPSNTLKNKNEYRT